MEETPKFIRSPSVEKAQECPGIVVVAVREQLSVKILEGGVFARDARDFVRSVFGADAKRKRGLVPQEVRQGLTGSLDGARHSQATWTRFLARRVAHVSDVLYASLLGENDGVRDVLPREAEGGDFPVRGETFVQAHQRPQNRHPRTSSESGGGTSITPSRRVARKKRGAMSLR